MYTALYQAQQGRAKLASQGKSTNVVDTHIKNLQQNIARSTASSVSNNVTKTVNEVVQAQYNAGVPTNDVNVLVSDEAAAAIKGIKTELSTKGTIDGSRLNLSKIYTNKYDAQTNTNAVGKVKSDVFSGTLEYSKADNGAIKIMKNGDVLGYTNAESISSSDDTQTTKKGTNPWREKWEKEAEEKKKNPIEDVVTITNAQPGVIEDVVHIVNDKQPSASYVISPELQEKIATAHNNKATKAALEKSNIQTAKRSDEPIGWSKKADGTYIWIYDEGVVPKQEPIDVIKTTDGEYKYVYEVVEADPIGFVKHADGTYTWKYAPGTKPIKGKEPISIEYNNEGNIVYKYPQGPVLNKQMGHNLNGPSGDETYYNLDMSRISSGCHPGGWIYQDAAKHGNQHNLDGGSYWVRDDGVKMWGNYVMVAANLGVHPRGSLVETSLGTGIVVDTGTFADSHPNRLDIATQW